MRTSSKQSIVETYESRLEILSVVAVVIAAIGFSMVILLSY